MHAYPSGGAAVIGGVVYRGKAMPQRIGQYFFADYYYKMKTMDDPYAAKPVVTDINPIGHKAANADEIFSFGTDPEGEVYVLCWTGIYLLEEAEPTGMQALQPPRSRVLRATGPKAAFPGPGAFFLREGNSRDAADAAGREVPGR